MQRLPLAAQPQLIDVPLDQPGHPDAVPRGQRMVHGVIGQPVLVVPGGRGPVQFRHPVRLGLPEAGLEQVGEQLVVAPPAPHLIQGDQEQVCPLHLFQQLLAVATATDGVAQRPRQPLQHRGLQQEPEDLLRLAGQHLLGEVVQDVALAAAERSHKTGRVGVVAQRQSGQLQPRRPPLGARGQVGQAARRQLQPHDLPHQHGGFFGREAQVALTQLGQLAAGPQPGQWQRRVGAAGTTSRSCADCRSSSIPRLWWTGGVSIRW
jgi:hypothetical protein